MSAPTPTPQEAREAADYMNDWAVQCERIVTNERVDRQSDGEAAPPEWIGKFEKVGRHYRLAAVALREKADRDEAPLQDIEGVKRDFALAVLRNAGVDVSCGACMEAAFTGVTTHAHTCHRDEAVAAEREALIATAQADLGLVFGPWGYAGMGVRRRYAVSLSTGWLYTLSATSEPNAYELLAGKKTNPACRWSTSDAFGDNYAEGDCATESEAIAAARAHDEKRRGVK